MTRSTGRLLPEVFGAGGCGEAAIGPNLGQLAREFEADPEMAPLLAEGRRTVAREWYDDGRETLARLRLEAGLSQAQLAARAATSQSHIARIELGLVDPGTDLIGRVAAALSVAPSRAFEAIRAQRETRGQRHG